MPRDTGVRLIDLEDARGGQAAMTATRMTPAQTASPGGWSVPAGAHAGAFREPPVDRRAPGPLDELRAAHAAMVEAVVSRGGLGRVAKLAADAVHGTVAIVVPRLGVAISPEGRREALDLAALGSWVAERTRGRPAAVPPGVLAEAPVRFRGDVVGVVVLLAGGLPPRSDAFEFLHVAAAAAVTELAVEDAREETEQQLKGAFLEELRSREDLSGPEVVRRAARLGCDLAAGGAIICAEPTSNRAQLVAATIAAEHPGALAQTLEEAAGGDRDRVYAALPVGVGDGTPTAVVASARQIAARLQRHALVGISSFHADPAGLASAVREAELMLAVLQQSGGPIANEIGSGTYKLLFRMFASHPEELRTFYEGTVASLVRYDEHSRTELVSTLQAYLDANCNMNATATAIFAHRHTVAYRLERIRELTGLDPMISEHRERLGLGLKVHRIVAPGQEAVSSLGRRA